MIHDTNVLECRLVDGDLNICQSQAILRHLGRKLNLYGTSDAERAQIDFFLDGIVALRRFYLELVYMHNMVRSVLCVFFACL
jgi:glutathione S-transferase